MSQNQTKNLTNLHELVDREDPKCLYCGKQCEVSLEGTRLSGSNLIEDHDILLCRSLNCRERFRIDSIQHPDGETEFVGFHFTCKGYLINYKYDEKEFEIADRSRKRICVCPPFEVDFSDKNKLYEKIKTYIVFS